MTDQWTADVTPNGGPVDEDAWEDQLTAFAADMAPQEAVIREPADGYPVVRFKVGGAAAPQGSKSGFALRKGGVLTGKVAMRESSKRNPQWRTDVAAAATHAMQDHPLLAGPLLLEATFVFPRPASHYTGRGALTKSAALTMAPTQHNIGDLSKLIRSIEDSMIKIVFLDDSQITTASAKKRWGIAAATYILVKPDPIIG